MELARTREISVWPARAAREGYGLNVQRQNLHEVPEFGSVHKLQFWNTYLDTKLHICHQEKQQPVLPSNNYRCKIKFTSPHEHRPGNKKLPTETFLALLGLISEALDLLSMVPPTPHPPTTHPTSCDILERCDCELTQNANESFPSKMWSCARKAKFAGFKRLSFVAVSNIGPYFWLSEGKPAEIKVNSKALRFSLSQDKERKHSKGKLQPKAKKKE
ncbi:hypothetical protein GWK47_038523 [Chionoecetes opilio]|uniref:Uncharacterized protein n=1 Tax=Chionoecetes opilio TaxID=41210 RepID=A0A8J4YCI9_CHIOP|nr:hypothetical protein GWK47_038523 [Chionoecetes opilio]